MLFVFVQAARRARTARRNYRILSELDDATLRDIGLDRSTLRQFCDDGCMAVPGPAHEPRAHFPVLLPGIMRPALR